MEKIVIYTDGACSNNPGPGGYCAIIQRTIKTTGEVKERVISGAEYQTTNNRMEITAVLKGLEAIAKPSEIDVYSDSAYVCNSFNEGWLDSWPEKKWRNSSNKPVLNKDLWQRMIVQRQKHVVRLHKVTAHADDFLNNRCDALARRQIMKVVRSEKLKEKRAQKEQQANKQETTEQNSADNK